MLGAPAATVRRARALRREMSLPEVLLWRVLRMRPAGLKFRRQHPVGPYVADFFCFDRCLVVEIDGSAHDRGDAPRRDARRDAYFAGQGIATIRVPVPDVLDNLDGVVRQIVQEALARQPLHQPSAGPPPRFGEDLVYLPTRKLVAITALISIPNSLAASITAILVHNIIRG